MDWKRYVEIEQRYFRPAEVDILLGDASKDKEKLKWMAKVKFNELINTMLKSDMELIKQEKTL